MGRSRALKWAGGVLVALVALIALLVGGLLLIGGNWLREPIARMSAERTGRALTVEGDIRFGLGWPLLKIRADTVKFANPPWAKQAPYMVTADEAEVGLPLASLLSGHPAIEELTLRRADVSLEKDAEGRRNWLLDQKQKDEEATVAIGRLALQDSRIAYDEPSAKTSIRAEVSSTPDGGLAFKARGRYKGLSMSVEGSGGSLLRLRDESRPYPFKIAGTIGPTKLKLEGSVTGLSRVSALDIKVDVGGDSLSQLYPLIGIALPETHAYKTSGRVEHKPTMWRYEKFATRVGDSDFTGTIQVDTGGKRPFLHGDLVFGKLNMADLGPVIGTRHTEAEDEDAEPAGGGRHVLPRVPFRTDRWASVDADIKLSARSIVRPHDVPLQHFATNLKLRDSLLVLDPLNFGIAGGELVSAVTLDGRKDPIRAHAKVKVRKIALDAMFPGFNPSMVDPGRVDGEADLAGKGESVGEMLGSASGNVALVVAGGHVSRLVMESVGLHIPEIVALKAGGDEPVPIRCGAAEFNVTDGVMHARTLVFDTTITTVHGSGDVDLGNESLDLMVLPETKKTSLLSLRTPIHIRGTLGKPQVQPDTGRMAAKGIGAAVLGVANPLLLLLPLIDQGPGKDSDCGRLFASAGVAGKAAPPPSQRTP